MLRFALDSSKLEIGCDEAGRGCLSGPVYAGAVLLPPGFHNELLNDSKKLSEKHRYELRPIIEREALAWGVGVCTAEEIDEINILNASILSMHRATDQLLERLRMLKEALDDGDANGILKDRGLLDADGKFCGQRWDGQYLNREIALLIDGNRFKPYHEDIPFTTVIKGDGKLMPIAAASILAKTYRDDYMKMLDVKYPQYNWKKNAGYPTKQHRQAIREFGITPYHRKSFRLLPDATVQQLPFVDE